MNSSIKQENTELIETDENDPVVKEIDVYLAKSLSNNIYLLQYPIRPQERSYENTIYLGAKIKPKQSKLEIELELDTANENYSKAKGEQFALNVDGKLTGNVSLGAKLKQDLPQQRYYKSNVMDKQVLTSTNGCLGQMNRLYHLGVLNNNQLHLTPVQSILQMKPSFDYFDIFEKKVKDIKEPSQTNETDYSTEEEIESELEKAELVTLKYSSNVQTAQQKQQQQEQDENWIQLEFANLNDPNSAKVKEMLYCKKQSDVIKMNISEEEFISRLIDSNLNNSTNEVIKIEKV